MAVYLPILTALLAGSGWLGGGLTLVIALGAVSVVLSSRSYGRSSRRSSDSRRESAAAQGARAHLAGRRVAQQLQVSAAVGAFLVGIALSGPLAQPRAETCSARCATCSPRSSSSSSGCRPTRRHPPVPAAIALALAVTTVTKIATGWWAARRAGIGPRAGCAPAARSSPRGEFSIVIAGSASPAAWSRSWPPSPRPTC